MAKVNLDALIPREDFEATGVNNSGNLKHSLSVSDFSTTGFFYPFMRKPDFQRETNEWDARKITDFVESYINGDLIPSVILWRSDTGLFFVIDGAHRLSALIAWINNDYGDGEISQAFYGNISEEQRNIAGETRKYINKKIGAYKDIINTPNQPNPNHGFLNKAKNLAAFSIQVQWVDGDASKAENSFFKINQQGEPLNKTEIKLLQSRKKGNAVAARAIIRAGKGHKYWSNYTAENQKKIQEISEEINKILFMPPLKKTVKSLDILPVAGRITSSQTLPLILDYVNIVNQISNDFETKLSNDTNGDETLRYLQKARKVAWRINSVHPSSLGLHPIVYFYSSDGRHKTASFYAIIAWIVELEDKSNNYKEFIKVRHLFEQLLLKYDYLIQDINRKYRQAINSYTYIKDFYIECINQLISGKNVDESVLEIIKNKKFNYLKIDISETCITQSEFTTEKKSAIFIKEALSKSLTCKICNGLIHQNSMTFDHIIRREDGGMGSIENGQITHPFCNSTIKN
jgi:hypothetical protein